ncbi:hypothetical protein BBK36DRAFT_1117793 [Trichoderma citrinoviride]|uniref:Uncharacterized protein n=1 Tax=Trichoderma citrinoviride TaxID=58853 RepID=A0A2T4BBK3_9HYPO|nr:hypothetical protein BBK36DRAFT_1117793 [Trichoderma citrinoviride]PTB66697.1 hypothetical protein BBK36DRAFT_1117793 [Trichoderma citrinoviride]
MALWPFRTRGDKRSAAAGDAASGRKIARAASVKRTRDARRYSFSPDRQDAIQVDRANQNQNEHLTGENAPAHNTLGQDRVPTLHHKRSGNQPSRRKSSKRKRQDHNREAEIKAMSTFAPARATTETFATGRSSKHDHKRAKTLPARAPWESRNSDLSLPIPMSIESRMSFESNYSSYRVTALDALAPRPTLRYQGTRLLPSRASVPTRSGSQRNRLAAFDEETLKAHKRIDELADDFDASELRELMERDARRRERNRQREREKAERRLARRAEKQKMEEETARERGTPSPENLERGVMGRELGLGIDPPSTIVTSSKQRTSPEPMSDVEEYAPKTPKTPQPEPLETFHRIDTAPREPEPTPAPERQRQASGKSEPRVPAVPPAILKLEGHVVPKTSTSGSTFDSDKDKTSSAMDDDATTRKGSEASSKTNRISFSTLLRWGRGRRSSGGPSSFSNTSREEMSAVVAAAAAAHAHSQARSTESPVSSYSGNYLSSKPGSGPPKRTRSRFREDLPELPLSPPRSRLQSPEADASLPSVAEHKPAVPEPIQIPTLRDDTPTSGHRSIDIPHARAARDKMYGSHSADPHLSMSLASVDSEASWLSGRVGSQRSQRLSSVRDRIRSRQQDRDARPDSPSNSAHEDLEITEDDYMSRLSPDPTALTFNSRLSGEGRPSSDGEEMVDEGEVRWGAVGAHPQLVSSHTHHRDTIRSREGLLNIDSGDEEDFDAPISPISPITPSMDEKVDLERATSVRVDRHHSRNFSAGSAKLLEIHPRESTDNKRRSQEPSNGV